MFFQQNRGRARDTRVSYGFLRRCCWFIASLGTRLVVVVAPPWHFLSFLFHRGVSTATHGIVCRLNKTNNLNKSARCGLRSKDVCGVYVCACLFLNRIRYFLLIPLISTQFTADRDRSHNTISFLAPAEKTVHFSITVSIINYDYASCSLLLLSAVRDIVAIRFLSPNAHDVASRSLYPESIAICSIRKRISFL